MPVGTNRAELLRTGKERLGQWMAHAREKPLIPLIAASALVTFVVVIAFLWASGPSYHVLYSNLTDRDGGRIIAALQGENVPYKLAEGGHAVLVPADDVYRLRLQLAEKGLPDAGNVGLGILDKERFGTSRFTQRVDYQRALQGELASTIEVLRPVAAARVELALPDRSLFVSQQRPAKATVVVTLRPGRSLSAGQVEAITHMVSSAVRDLSTDDVTVVDQDGNLLSNPPLVGGLNPAQLGYAQAIETAYEHNIVSILTPIVGAGNVHAKVVAQINFDKTDETSEDYGPNQGNNPQSVLSHQTTTAWDDAADGAQGIPGALSNTPPGVAPSPVNKRATARGRGAGAQQTRPSQAAEAAAAAGKGGLPGYNIHRASTTNYDVDKDIKRVTGGPGTIQRLSVAVVVNEPQAKQKKGGSMVPVPLSAAEMAQIKALAGQAVGLSTARGDSLKVVDAVFRSTALPVPKESFLDRIGGTNTLWSALRYLIAALVLGFLYWKIIKPLLRRYLEPTPAAHAEPSVDVTVGGGEEEDVVDDEPSTPKPQHPTYDRKLHDLTEIAKENPGTVARVLRHWLKDHA